MSNLKKLGLKGSPLKSSEIILLKGFGNYTWIYLANGTKKLLCKTMHTILEEFPEMAFIRTHKSYSVNPDFVVFQGNQNKNDLLMANGLVVEVSRRKKKEFLSTLNLMRYSQNNFSNLN